MSDPVRETVYLTRQIPIQGGALYRADCFVRTEDVRAVKGRLSSVGAGLIVEWCDRGGKWMQGGTYACNLFGTDDWRQVKCTGLRAPDDAGYALVFLTLRGTGRAWFDDFRLVKVNGSISKSCPQDGATVNSNCPTFIWKQNPGVRRHWVELSQNPGFEDGTVRRYAAGGMTEFQVTDPLDRGVWYWRVVAKGIEDRRPWRFTQTASKDRDCLAPIPLERARRVTRGDEPFTVKIRASAAERPDVSVGNWRGVPGVEENGTIAFRFDPPAAGWPEGFQETRIKTCDCTGNRKELPFWFLNKPRPENPAQIDKHGRFSENGRPIFPLGIYEVAPKYMQEVRHAGFDVVHSYRWEYTQDDESCRKYLDACWAADGLRAFIGFDRGVNSGNGIVQGELAPIARRVGALADHPGLFCWYLFDEPELFGQFVTPDKLTEMADLVRALDPYHAVVMTTWNKTMSEYRRTWDTHWTQAYGNPAQVAEEIDKHRLFLKNDSPITLLVNCNDVEQSIARRKGVPPDPTRFSRDYDHLRACALLGIVRECNGVWWWWFARDSKDYYSAAQCPQAWSNLVSVVREIGDLRPIVTAEGTVTTGCVKTETGNVEWWRKSVGGESVLIAVNTGTESVSCRLEPRVGDFGTYSFRPHEVKVLRNAEGPFVIFGEADADGRGAAEGRVLSVDVLKPWTLSFSAGWGAPEKLAIEKLVPWCDLPVGDEAKAFSGTVTYRTRFRGAFAKIDLGRVKTIAEVKVNGKSAGTLWCEPYVADVAGLCTESENELEIAVTSTWHDRLWYDGQRPEAERKAWTLPYPKDLSAGRLLPYGLLGKVRHLGLRI